MVPFSFPQPRLKSRVMKEHLTDVLDDGINGFLDNGSMVSIIDRDAGLVGKTCRFAPIKELPCLPRLPSKNSPEPNPFPEAQPAPGILYFLSVPIGVHPWFKKDLGFKAILKGFKAI
jgi:hypothetical protein